MKTMPTFASKTLALLAGLLLCVPSLLTAAERRPNFLFIYTDDQRWDAIGLGGSSSSGNLGTINLYLVP